MAKKKVSRINQYVLDWAEATGLVIRASEDRVRIVLEATGDTLGAGTTVALAADAAVGSGKAGEREQAIRMLAALSFNGEELVDAVMDLWEEDDGDEEEDVEEEEEDEDE